MTLGLNKETLKKLIDNEVADVIGGEQEERGNCTACNTKPAKCGKTCPASSPKAKTCHKKIN